MSSLAATGYVHDLIDKKQTFPQFAMSCAKAFGACIMMRDDPSDTPIPDEFQPSDYDLKALAETRKELATLEATIKIKSIDDSIASQEERRP